jgi:peroxiredoxin
MLGCALACVRADVHELDEPVLDEPVLVDPRVAVDDPAYGADSRWPDLLALGDRLALDHLPLADARAAGPVVLLWFGGAEHAELTGWVRELAAGVSEFESRGATLVIVRPLPPERAEAFAIELGLQAVVVADETGVLTSAGGFSDPLPEWAVLIVDRQALLRYRKLGGRRPALDELLGVLDGESPRCCIADCPNPACE